MTEVAIYPEPATAVTRSQFWLYVLFFLSGFPALIYQIVWQRALFPMYGVNVESAAVVVTAFMLGLGLGSLFGGRVSRSRISMIPLFECWQARRDFKTGCSHRAQMIRA